MGLIVGAALVAIALVVAVAVRRRPVGALAAVGDDIVAGVVATPATVALLTRWRDRAARWRTAAALPVVLATIGVSGAVRHELRIGVGDHPAWSDPLLMGLLSVFLGAILAELHHLRPRRTGVRAAHLAPRELVEHLPPHARIRSALLAVLALVASLLAVTVGGQRVPLLGLLALLVAGLVPIVQRGIVGRGRPAVAATLLAADDAVRRLAVRTVDEAGAGVVLLLTAWQLAPTYVAASVPAPVAVAMIVAQLASLGVAIVWWRRSDPRRLLPDVPRALDAGAGAVATAAP
jgi:hypothetical protein